MKRYFTTAVTVAVSCWFSLAAPSYGATSYTIWGSSSPTVADSGPDSAVELGVRFRADAGGTITGIRFYKAKTNTGTHVASLWSNTGTRLATATFTGETASGWQQVNFAQPVTITANTVYLASYHTNAGHYSDDANYFTGKSLDNAPLHALKDGDSGFNGAYLYGSTSNFPSKGWLGSNYWVDVVFVPTTTTTDTTAPTVTAFTIPGSSTSLTVPISTFTATDNVGVTRYLVNESAATPSGSAGWSTTPPTAYTFATAGNKTLYAWAGDAAGNISTAKSAQVTITLPPSGTGPEPAGWFAGDMHVHRSCGGAPEAVSSLLQKMSPQGLAVISLLADMGNGEVQNPATDLPLVNGRDDPASTSGRTVHWDAEWHWDPTYTQYPHQALGGHIVGLGLSNAHQIWEEYTYPIFNWAHQQNGYAGFAHMEFLDGSIPQSLTCCTPLEYPVEVALGAADFVAEDVTDTSHPVSGLDPEQAIAAYYRLLNCGFRPGLAAGTDYPCTPSGVGLGALLTYAQVAGGSFTYRNWVEGIVKGRTVVSRNGHNEFLDLKVNGSATPGDEIALTGAGTVQVTVTWTAIQGLSGTMELVQNGVVVASKQASVTSGSSASLSATVNFAKSGWLAARRMGNGSHQLHTAAVFVTVNGAPVRASADDANFFVQWIDNLLTKTSAGGSWSSYFVNSRSPAQARYQAAKVLYQQIATEAGSQTGGTTGSIFTSQTPTLFENDAAYELGTRFWSDVGGEITQVRIYTNATEGGSHTVRIWRWSDQTLVAGPFTWNITQGTAGWQGFTLPTAVTIAASTDYVVTVSTGSDHYYAEQPQGFAAPIVNGHLHTYAGSGVYGETLGVMPTSTWSNTNYFRDVVFTPQP